jgi:hypothetical protein
MHKIEINRTQTIILLIVFIAIGGIVLYGTKNETVVTNSITTPKIQGPSTPPPGYANPR